MYLQNVPHMATPGAGHSGHPDKPQGWQPEDHKEPDFVPPPEYGGSAVTHDFSRMTSFSRSKRSESLSAMNRRVDFSLGARDGVVANASGDVFDNQQSRPRIPQIREVGPESERDPEDQIRPAASFDTMRSNSRFYPHMGMPNHLQRRSTDRSSTHRNRFYGRFRSTAGPVDEIAMESGLANIPAGRASLEPIDPRTGHVGPSAVRIDSEPLVFEKPGKSTTG